MSECPFRAIADAWREDADFRAAVEEDAKTVLASKGSEIHGPVEVSVAVDTEDVTHFVFPPAPNETLPDIMLGGVSGGTFHNIALHTGRNPHDVLRMPAREMSITDS